MPDGGQRDRRSVREFGQLLRTLRRRALLTQEHLAQLSGLGTRTVRDLERGRTERPHCDTVRLLADALRLRGDARASFESAAAGHDPRLASQRHRPVPCQLPADVADFTGRSQQVTDLEAHLLADPPTGIAIAVVSGKAGVGKTALAVHVAHLLRDRFPDGQLFLNLGGVGGRAVDPGEALTRILQGLGVEPSAVPHDLDERAALYRSHLADRRILILIDNARDETQVRPLLPGSSRAAALITSRSRLLGLEASHWLLLHELDVDESLELLMKVAGADLFDPVQRRTIVSLCAQLPLAVRIAGARLATTWHERPEWLIERLADESRRLDELQAGDLAVRASFNFSYQALDLEVRAIFLVLGLLNASDFPAWVPAALTGRTESDAERLLGRLIDANLLDLAGHDPAGRVRYRLHDLLAVFARERLQEERTVTGRVVGLGHALGAWLSIVDWFEARLPEGLSVGRGQAQGSASRHPEAAISQAWLTRERIALVAPIGGDVDRAEGESGWAIVCAMVAFSFELRAHWDDWIATREVSLHSARRVGDRIAGETSSGDLVVAFGHAGEWDQVTAQVETCERVFRELGERRWQAAALVGLGNLRRAQGEFAAAACTLGEAVALSRQSGAASWEAAALFSLASVQTVSGCLAEAEKRYQECLAIFQARGDSTWQAHTLRGLGYAYQQHGRFEEAVLCLERCLPVFRELGDRLFEAYTELTLAYAQRGLKRLEAAAAHAVTAQAILEEIGDQRGQAMALRARGTAALGLRQAEEALACFGACLSVFRALSDPIGAACATFGLGCACRDLDHRREAIRHFRCCLSVFRELDLKKWQTETLQQLSREDEGIRNLS